LQNKVIMSWCVVLVMERMEHCRPFNNLSPRFNYRGAYIFFPVLLINHPLSLFWKEENAWYAIFFLCQLMPLLRLVLFIWTKLHLYF